MVRSKGVQLSESSCEIAPPSRQREDRIAALARRQQGLVARAQLINIGLSAGAIDWRLQAGRLEVVHHGVYQVGPIAGPHAREMAAVLACGKHAVVSHGSAAVLWRLCEASMPSDAVHITAVGSERRRVGIVSHRVGALPDREVTTWNGIPITTAARTVVDLASELEDRPLEQVIARAERRGLTTTDAILSLVSMHPNRPGSRRLKGLLSQGASLTRSEAEDRLRTLIERAKLPAPRLNARVIGFEVDAIWPDQGVVVEVDGFAHHRSRASFERDRARDADLVAAGFAVLRITWRQLVGEPEAVVARVAVALSRGGDAVRRAPSYRPGSL